MRLRIRIAGSRPSRIVVPRLVALPTERKTGWWPSPPDDVEEIEIMTRPPIPPFNSASAAEKVRLAEDAWNTRDPARVALAYTPDSRWRNRVEFLEGRAAIEAFLARKWNRELDYRLIKEL